jgi:hypothetical protein
MERLFVRIRRKNVRDSSAGSVPGGGRIGNQAKQVVIDSLPEGGGGKRGETCELLQIDFTIRKNSQFREVSKPHFSPPVPERRIVDPEKLRRLRFVPAGQAKRFTEKMPVHRFVGFPEVDALR